MKFPINSRPAACVSDDAARPSLTSAQIMVFSESLRSRRIGPDDSRALPATAIVATDGRTMSIVPAELDVADVPGPIGAKELEAARKATPKRADAVICKLDLGTVQTADGASLPRATVPSGHGFPDVEEFLTAPLPDGLPRKGADGSVSLCLDIALLNQVVEGLAGAKKGVVSLTFMADPISAEQNQPAIQCERMILVTVHGSDSIGVLMPVRD